MGSAILRKLKEKGYTNLVYRTSKELDLRRQAEVEAFFERERPEYVFLAAAKVGDNRVSYTGGRPLIKEIRLNSGLAKETGLSFLLKVSQAGFSFLTTVLLARILGAEGYGIYAYAYAFVTLFSMPAQAGLPQLVVRETARGMAEGRPEVVKSIWRWATKIIIFNLSFFLTVVVIYFFIFKKNNLGSKDWTFLGALLLVPFICLGNLRGAALRGLQRVLIGQLPEFFIRPFLFLSFLCIAYFLFHLKLTPPQVMVLHVFAAVLAFIVGTWLLYCNTPPFIRKVKVVCREKDWLKSLMPLVFVASMWTINTQVDIIILGLFCSDREVGIYRVAAQVALLSLLGFQAINQITAPRYSSFYAQNDFDRFRALVKFSVRFLFIYNLLLFIFWLSFGKVLLVFIFGKEFLSSYLPLLILLFGRLLNSTVGNVSTILNMIGFERYTAFAIGFSALINVFLNFLLIPSYGSLGASTSTSISMIVWGYILYGILWKKADINTILFLKK